MAPSVSPSLCTAAQIAALKVACLDRPPAVACTAFIDANPACARCIQGALRGDVPANVPLGALLPFSEDGALGLNTASCAALAIGRPDCAVPLAALKVCQESACDACAAGADDEACQAYAAAVGPCAPLANPGCAAAIAAQAATWGPICTGATFDESYTKVTGFLCGPP